jgi:hypothetical protein
LEVVIAMRIFVLAASHQWQALALRTSDLLRLLVLATLAAFADPGVRAAQPEVWLAETVKFRDGPDFNPGFQQPIGLDFDAAGRPLVTWTESLGSGGNGSGWWARREADGWKVRELTQSRDTGVFSLYHPQGAAAFAFSTNGAPYYFHAAANFGNAVGFQFYVVRVPLEASPEGPGGYAAFLPGSAGVHASLDADGRASNPPDLVAHMGRGQLRLNDAVDLTTNSPLLGDGSAHLVFRQGPQRQIHVVYPTDEGHLRYNGGSPERDRAILRINTGSNPHALAIDDANGIHVSAVQGTGQYFYGAYGQLVYLHSADGTTWTTNRIADVPADVGATAIALDAAGRPAIAFTRGFQALYFTRLADSGWTPPTLIRSGLGGWDRSRGLRLAFGPKDVPHIAVADHASRRLLVLRGETGEVPTDLVVSAAVPTHRVAVGSNLVVTVTVTNAGPRNASATVLHVQLPPEFVVRDVTPRPKSIVQSRLEFELGTVHALEPRSVTLTLATLDPGRLELEASVVSEAPESQPDNNRGTFDLAEFLPAPCLADPAPAGAGCGELALLPRSVPPAVADQPWSLVFRVPSAPPGSRLQVSGSTPLPPGFCLTADGELRGVHGAAGFLPLNFELVERGGRVTSFTRDIDIAAPAAPAGLVAFWPLDGSPADMVSGVEATLGARATYLPGAAGLGLQSAHDALNTGADFPALSQPARLFTSPPLLDGAPFGQGAVTVTGWFRRDRHALARGDARPFGYVLGLIESDTWTRERFLAFDPASGRLDLLDGPPDFRANVVRGPTLSPDSWHHLAFVCQGTAVRLYTNGVLAAEGTFRAPLVDRPRLVAGGNAHGGEFSGALDELAVFQRALASPEIASLRDSPMPRRTLLPPGGDFPLAAILHELVLPDAPQQEPYQATLAPAFCGNPVAFQLVAGALPDGLVLDPTGLIRGSSTTEGVVRFRVRATDAAGSAAELGVQITTRPGLPVFTRHPADQSVEAGDLLVLFAETRGPADLQWFRNGLPIPGQTESVLAIPEFSAAQGGRYQVRARNAAGTTWSQEIRVSLRTSPARPPTVDVAPVMLRPDGLVRLRFETLRGRIYELQRATDLGAALAGGWRLVQRFVSPGGIGELTDVIPGRPDAAFYRVVEILPPPAAAFSVEDTGRYVGLAEDGQIRPGLLPAEDPATGRLGPFEFRVGGEQVPLDQGLVLRLPQGADPVARDGGTALRFTNAELFFGEESPVQLDEGGTNRVVLAGAGAGLEIPSGPLSVEILERLLGKPRGSGIGLTFFRHFRFQLLSGTFDGTRIRNAQMAWADRAAAGLPTPDRTGDYLDFDIELSATRLRLPFYGEFELPDSSPTPGRFTVSKAAPIWVELRPGPEIALGGRARATFANGPEFDVDFRFDQPVFRASLAAKRFRLPENLSLGRFLPVASATTRHGRPRAGPGPGRWGRTRDLRRPRRQTPRPRPRAVRRLRPRPSSPRRCRSPPRLHPAAGNGRHRRRARGPRFHRRSAGRVEGLDLLRRGCRWDRRTRRPPRHPRSSTSSGVTSLPRSKTPARSFPAGRRSGR